MPLSTTRLEELASWCAECDELARARAEARRTFFAETDPRPVRYWEGAGDFHARGRRFLGWFMFQFPLPGGRTPAALAADQLPPREREQALRALAGHRYVLAAVNTILPAAGKVFLELEGESFEVRYRPWAHLLERGHAVLVHLLPVRAGIWLPGPGWLQLPYTLGPNMRAGLSRLQPDPIAIERMLQGRVERELTDVEAIPEAASLAEAVARMDAAAEAAGAAGLRLSVDEWTALVQAHLHDTDFAAYSREVFARMDGGERFDQIQLLTRLASEIWNLTPQPDRGGLSARELSEMSDPQAGAYGLEQFRLSPGP